MIVQFFRYGNGLSKGPLDYLLGKDRDRDYAKVLQGDVSEVSGLIDTSPFAKKYTSGCLSFYEHDLSDQDKQQIMQNFEQALFPGMDQRQYRVLWIEHQDKKNEETGKRRLELNFLIPNIEILTGNVYSHILTELIVLELIYLRRLQTMNINCMMQMTHCINKTLNTPKTYLKLLMRLRKLSIF